MSSFLLGVSLSPRNRVLGWIYTFEHGQASGFFIFRARPRVQDHNHRGRPMLLSVCPASHHPATAGIANVRRTSLFSCDKPRFVTPPHFQSEPQSDAQMFNFALKKRFRIFSVKNV